MKRNFFKEKLVIPTIILLSVQFLLICKLVIDHLLLSYWAGIEIETLAIVSALFILVLFNAFYSFVIQDREKNEKYIKKLAGVGIVVLVITFFNYIYQGMWLQWKLYFIEGVYLYGWKIYQYIYLVSFVLIIFVTVVYVLLALKIIKGKFEKIKEKKMILLGDRLIFFMLILYLILETIAFGWL